MKLSCEDTYRNLSTFDSVDQLNESARNHARQLTGTEAAVFDVLSRHSCKYPGVSFLTKTNIGKLVGKSRRTIIRICQRLEELGMIRQYELRRQSDGQQTSNAIVILPGETRDVTRNEAPVTQVVTPLSPSLSDKPKELLSNTSSPYRRFKELIADKKLRNRIYGVFLAHTSYLKNAYDPAVLLNVGITAAMTAFKSTGVRNIVGYYNGVLDKMLDKLYFAEVIAGE
jgi:DNA-binding Lrp family transcriptional regulator